MASRCCRVACHSRKFDGAEEDSSQNGCRSNLFGEVKLQWAGSREKISASGCGRVFLTSQRAAQHPPWFYPRLVPSWRGPGESSCSIDIWMDCRGCAECCVSSYSPEPERRRTIGHHRGIREIAQFVRVTE